MTPLTNADVKSYIGPEFVQTWGLENSSSSLCTYGFKPVSWIYISTLK